MKLLIRTAALAVLAVASARAQPRVVINEIMYAPIAPEPEWVELVNAGTDTARTGQWHIEVTGKAAPLPDTALAPGALLLLTKDTAKLRAAYSLIGAPMLRVALSSLNNGGDDVVLKDTSGVVLDTVAYLPSWGGSGGISLERIDALAASDSENFGSCIDTAGATPGLANSIRRRESDVAPLAIVLDSLDGVDANLRLMVGNRGRKPIEGVHYLLRRSDSALPIVSGFLSEAIAPAASDTANFKWMNADVGRIPLELSTETIGDEFEANDTLRETIDIPVPSASIVINELMITPESGFSQWIELYNRRNGICDLAGATLRVTNADTTYRFTIKNLLIQPKQFAIITAKVPFTSKTIPAFATIDTLSASTLHLQADGSGVALHTIDDALLDSVHYDRAEYSPNLTSTTGISLERRHTFAPSTDPANWGSSVDASGSTPLGMNSLSKDSLAGPLRLGVSPDPFTPDDDGRDDEARITVFLSDANEQLLTVRLYDERGRLRRTIAEAQRVAGMAYFDFDGTDDRGENLPVGLYTIRADANGTSARTGIVIARRLR